MLGFISDVWAWKLGFYGLSLGGVALVIVVAVYFRSLTWAMIVAIVMVGASGYAHIKLGRAEVAQAQAELADAVKARDVAVAARKTAEAERDKAISAARANADALIEYRAETERAARLAAASCARDRARDAEIAATLRKVCNARPAPAGDCAAAVRPIRDILDSLRGLESAAPTGGGAARPAR